MRPVQVCTKKSLVRDGESPSAHTHLPGGKFSSCLYLSYEMQIADAKLNTRFFTETTDRCCVASPRRSDSGDPVCETLAVNLLAKCVSRDDSVCLCCGMLTSISLDRVFHMPIAQVINKLARDTRCSGLAAGSQSIRRRHRFFADSLQ